MKFCTSTVKPQARLPLCLVIALLFGFVSASYAQSDAPSVTATYTTDNLQWTSFAEGDTVPDGSYVLFSRSADPGDRFQIRVYVRFQSDEPNDEWEWLTRWSPFEYSDTLGFHVGPFDYDTTHRTVTGTGVPGEDITHFRFVAGFPPLITKLTPGQGHALVVRDPATGSAWPENEVPHAVDQDNAPPGTQRYWDGEGYVFAAEPEGPDWFRVPGKIIRYRVHFEGNSSPSDPANVIRRWSYEVFGENDPENRVKEGAGADVWDEDFTPPAPNEWLMSEQVDGVELFVPDLLWLEPGLFDPGEQYHALGVELARQMGQISLRVRGITRPSGDAYLYCFLDVREVCPPDLALIFLDSISRRTEISDIAFTAHLGLDPANSGAITEYWPPPGYIVPVLVSGLRARMSEDSVELEWEWGLDAVGTAFRVDRIAPDGSVERIPLAESEIIAGPALLRNRPVSDLEGQILRYELVRESSNGDEVIAQTQILFELPRADRLALHANVPNPFNPNTQLSFELPQEGFAKLVVHDVRGRRVRELVGETLRAGRHERVWDGRADDGALVASGVYFARLESLGKIASIRMLLAK